MNKRKKLTKKQKKMLWVVMWAGIVTYSMVLVGVFLILSLQSIQSDVILSLLYALVTFGLLLLWAFGVNQLPFKKII